MLNRLTGSPESPLTLLYVGRLAPGKGYYTRLGQSRHVEHGRAS